MDEQEVSATDAQCASVFHKLGVHIPCGQIRGPVPADVRSPAVAILPVRRPSTEVVGMDVSREYDLCIICFRATAGGASKFSWGGLRGLPGGQRQAGAAAGSARASHWVDTVS